MKKLLLSAVLSIATFSAFAQSEKVKPSIAPVISQYNISENLSCAGFSEQHRNISKNNLEQVLINMKIYEFKSSPLLGGSKNITQDMNLTTLDNITSPFANTKEISYLSSVVNGVYTSDKLITGLTGFVKPQIKDGKISVDLCINKTDLISMTDFTSAGKTIQLPTTKNFQIYSKLNLNEDQAVTLPLMENIEITIRALKISNTNNSNPVDLNFLP